MYLKKDSKIIIQGITGKEGIRAAMRMNEFGGHVVAGVRPGKAGEVVEGVPVYDSVQDVISAHGAIDVSCIVVPPLAAKEAIIEAIDAGIPNIVCIPERIPIQDTSVCFGLAKQKGIRLFGPSSYGVLVPGIGRMGMLGGTKDMVEEIYTPGSIGIISRSGGMTNELAWQVRQAGEGQSCVVHVGGDLLMGMTYADLLRDFEQDPNTKGVIIFGEHGGTYEFEIVPLIEQKIYTKPLAIFIGGNFASSFPEGMTIGHAGAIVGKGESANEKKEALEAVGVHIVEKYEDLVPMIRKLM